MFYCNLLNDVVELFNVTVITLKINYGKSKFVKIFERGIVKEIVCLFKNCDE